MSNDASNDVKDKGGRPSIYTKELADKICLRLACGESLRSICRDEAMPAMSTVMTWLMNDVHDGFMEQYTHARTIQAECYLDDIIEIADDSTEDTAIVNGEERVNHEHINRARLRVDSRKWAVERLAPKKYGKQLSEVNHTSSDNSMPVFNIVGVSPDDTKASGDSTE